MITGDLNSQNNVRKHAYGLKDKLTKHLSTDLKLFEINLGLKVSNFSD